MLLEYNIYGILAPFDSQRIGVTTCIESVL